MAGTINRPPRGLLDFLGIKSFGKQPNLLGDVVMSTIEMLDWYALDARSSSYNQQLAATTASGQYPVLGAHFIGGEVLPVNAAGEVAVPQNEAWLVSRWSVLLTLSPGVGSTVDAIPSYRETIAARSSMPCDSHGPTDSAAEQVSRVSTMMLRYVWMPPASILEYTLLRGLIAAGETAQVNTRINLIRTTL